MCPEISHQGAVMQLGQVWEVRTEEDHLDGLLQHYFQIYDPETQKNWGWVGDGGGKLACLSLD